MNYYYANNCNNNNFFSPNNSDNPMTAVIRAKTTLSLHCPKLAFMMPENAPYVGAWKVLPIGATYRCQASQSQHTQNGAAGKHAQLELRDVYITDWNNQCLQSGAGRQAGI